MHPTNNFYSCGINPNTPFRSKNTTIDPKTVSLTSLGVSVGDLATYSDVTVHGQVREDARNKIEKQLMHTNQCSMRRPALYNELSYNLFKLNPNMVDSALKNTSLNQSNVHETLACAVNTIIYDDSYMANRFHDWFAKFKVIGKPSVQGVAVKSMFPRDHGNEPFVFKTPISATEQGLYHEAVVGFYGLNPLKYKIPNFMYIYGITDCSGPVIDTNNNNNLVESFCNRSDGKNKTPYLISENIADSMTFHAFINTPAATTKVVSNLIMQVMNALHLANIFCDYTHYDLHARNVMIYKLKDTIAIPFYLNYSQYPQLPFASGDISETNGEVLGIQYVAVIIDYGLSHLNVGGVGFGELGLEYAKVEAQKSFPLHDIYKLIMFLAEAIPEPRENVTNYEFFRALIAQMFGKNIKYKLQQKIRNKGFFVLPNAFRVESMVSAYDLAKPVLFISGAGADIYPNDSAAIHTGHKLYFNTGDKETYCSALSSLLGENYNYTLPQLYQSINNIMMSNELTKKQKTAKYVAQLKDIDVVLATESELKTTSDSIDVALRLTNDIKPSYTIVGITENELQTPSVYDSFEKMLRAIVRISSETRRLGHSLEIIAKILSVAVNENIITDTSALDAIANNYNNALPKLAYLSSEMDKKIKEVKIDDAYVQTTYGQHLNYYTGQGYEYVQKWSMFHNIVATL